MDSAAEVVIGFVVVLLVSSRSTTISKSDELVLASKLIVSGVIIVEAVDKLMVGDEVSSGKVPAVVDISVDCCAN